MRSPVGVLTKVACTMCYLSEQGRLRKTADAFGLSRSTVSVVVRKKRANPSWWIVVQNTYSCRLLSLRPGSLFRNLSPLTVIECAFGGLKTRFATLRKAKDFLRVIYAIVRPARRLH